MALPPYQVLNQSQLRTIHAHTLDILANTGIAVQHKAALEMLAEAGARILPAMPGFYHLPKTLDDIVDFVVGKTLDALQVEHRLFRRWGE